jgi:hypothetical protein
MKGDFQVRFCENLRVQLPRVTRLPASHNIIHGDLGDKS